MTNKDVLRELQKSAAFREMLPGLQAATVTLKAKFRTMHRGVNLLLYDVGRQVSIIRTKPSVYGADVDDLGVCLGVDMRILHQIAGMSEVFDREFIEAESTKPMKCGAYLSMGHFIALAGLYTEKEQTKMLKRIRVENLSCRQVHGLVIKSLSGRES
jgi:hypothetical protein